MNIYFKVVLYFIRNNEANKLIKLSSRLDLHRRLEQWDLLPIKAEDLN